ncbi:MAG TPA: SDR family oxidoreductase [Novosphingobium sp.]|nr:SDR family oxidoreductase [Novosphingobium sp.]
MALERQNLEGKVAIVTGGGRGVGRGIARVLAEAGAKVVLTARTIEQLDKSVADIQALGGTALGIPGDATSLEDAQRTVDATLDQFGRIDIMVNNVGGAHHSNTFMEITAEKLVADFQLNVVSAFNFIKLVAPHMKKAGGGSIINISSRSSAGYGSHGMTGYSIAKIGLEQLTLKAARALAPDVRVNAISLGTIEATWMDESRMAPEMVASIAAQNPLKRVGDPEDIGLAALYLCNDRCFANGSVVNVDGGMYEEVKYSSIPGRT